MPDHFGLALLLAPAATEHSLAALSIELLAAPSDASPCHDASLDALRRAIPAAAALPLLQALAQRMPHRRVVLDYLPAVGLQVEVVPVTQAALVTAA